MEATTILTRRAIYLLGPVGPSLFIITIFSIEIDR